MRTCPENFLSFFHIVASIVVEFFAKIAVFLAHSSARKYDRYKAVVSDKFLFFLINQKYVSSMSKIIMSWG